MGSHHFDCHRSIERFVDGLQHHPHAAGANYARDLVATQSPEHLWVICRSERIEHRLDLRRPAPWPLASACIGIVVSAWRIQFARLEQLLCFKPRLGFGGLLLEGAAAVVA